MKRLTDEELRAETERLVEFIHRPWVVMGVWSAAALVLYLIDERLGASITGVLAVIWAVLFAWAWLAKERT